MGLGAGIGQFLDGPAFGIERLELGPVVEAKAIDVIDEGLGRGVFGQDQRMVVEFDVEIGEDARNPVSRTIDDPLTNALAWISTPSTNMA